MPVPSYPGNRHFVSAADGTAVLVPTTAQERFQLSADKVQAHWGQHTRGGTGNTRGVLLASPSNPTGASVDPDELRRIHNLVHPHGGITLIDEISLALSNEPQDGQAALAIDQSIVTNNRSANYLHMNDWRLS